MTDLSKLTDDVAGRIMETEEYREYVSTLARIKEDPDLYRRINNIREQNFRIHTGDSDNVMDLVDALTNELEGVISIELASEFLEAEAAYVKLLQELSSAVVERLGFDR